MKPVVGIVGLGLVGTAIAGRLQAQGWAVVGHDHAAEARERFQATGNRAAASCAELGRETETIVLTVFDTAGVLQVLEGPAGLLQPGHRVRTVIDCTTGDPHLLVPLAARLAARGIAFVESPLSGSSQQIGAGEATALVGGSAEDVALCDPLLRALAGQIVHVGPAGMGARAKLATNLVLGLNRAVLAEGFAFARSLGIAPDVFLALVLATPARSDAALAKGAQMATGDFAPRSRIRQHLKDVDLMLADAARDGQPLPFTEVHAALLREAVAAGEGDLDNAAIVRRLMARRGPPKADDA